MIPAPVAIVRVHIIGSVLLTLGLPDYRALADVCLSQLTLSSTDCDLLGASSASARAVGAVRGRRSPARHQLNLPLPLPGTSARSHSAYSCLGDRQAHVCCLRKGVLDVLRKA